MRKILNRKSWPLIMCFLSPMFIMACYFVYRNMSPFGSQSILTVDLGQQYVDLFADFKHVLFSHPGGVLYSFSKAYGGEMLGTWAYYLMSPVNLLLLLIPVNQLPAGILFVILVKYGLAGLSFGYLLERSVRTNAYFTVMWSITYALNGWIIANQINPMWLDGMVWLPLIILGINQIVHQAHAKVYLIALIGALLTNYYTGYMIVIFTALYVIFKFVATPLNKSQFKRIVKQFGSYSVIGILLSAWLLLPTWYSLTQGKARYHKPRLANHLEYDPLKMLGKLFNGSLNFNQLPSGTPNLFIGSVAMIGFMIFMCQRKFSIRKRLSALGVTLFLVLSMCYQPLDLFWHGGQFPVWYPYRFSFIFCFWIIWLAANAVTPKYHINWRSAMIMAGLLASLIIYVFLHRIDFPFISPLHFILGTSFLLISFTLLIYTHNNSRIFAASLLVLSVMEMSLNTFNSLNNLSYVSRTSYTRSTRRLRAIVNTVQSGHGQPFRIGKSFYRSKNDPFSDHYSGGDIFDSSLESTTPQFMKRLGQPEGEGFATYTNGTLLTDRLLNYRYYLTTSRHRYNRQIFERRDVNQYPIVNVRHHVTIRRIPHPLPLIYMANPRVLHVPKSNGPVQFQQSWYQATFNQPNVKFKAANFSTVHRTNLRRRNHQLIVRDPLKTGTLSLSVRPVHHEIYYLLINPAVNPRNVKVQLNGHRFLPDTVYNHSLILNLNSGQDEEPINLTFQPRGTRFNYRSFRLYRLNAQPILSHQYHASAKITHFSDDKITGTLKATPEQSTVDTSVPATKGWHLKIDHHPVPIQHVANEFIGASVKPGKHTFTLTYVPPYLITGALLTLLTILGLVLRQIYRRRR